MFSFFTHPQSIIHYKSNKCACDAVQLLLHNYIQWKMKSLQLQMPHDVWYYDMYASHAHKRNATQRSCEERSNYEVSVWKPITRTLMWSEMRAWFINIIHACYTWILLRLWCTFFAYYKSHSFRYFSFRTSLSNARMLYFIHTFSNTRTKRQINFIVNI